MMKCSVIIPTYNRPKLLLRCLKALCNQTFPTNDYEIIVVTDGPDEVTHQAVEVFKQERTAIPEIVVMGLTEKAGPAAARNKGWRSARAAYILFTDDDTLPDKNWVSAYATAFSNQLLPIAFSGRIIVPLKQPPTDYERNIQQLETAEFVTANCACSITALEAVNGFDETFTMAWREDSDLEFKLISNDIPIMKIDDALVVHPVRTAAWGISILEQKKSMFNALLYKKFPTLYRKKIMQRPLWSYYIMVGSAFIAFACLLMNALLPAIIAFSVWLLQIALFTHKRLKGTSHKAGHLTEMLLTSAIIPFISIYWTLYGAYRFRVLFL